MGKVFFLALLSSTAVASLGRPWVGVVAAYCIAVLTPQAIWWWNFGDVRPALWILLPTFCGFLIAASRHDYDFSIIRNSRVGFLLVLWTAFAVSYLLGPYVDVLGPYRFTDPHWAFTTLNKIILLCLLACVCINDIKTIRALCFVFLFSVLYLVYWANDQYFFGHLIGRLHGPVDLTGVGIYSDENSFGMLFVVASPYLWCIGNAFRNRVWRWALWLTIPFAWHAMFLTASRAGLLGIAFTTFLLAMRSRRKFLGIALIPAFVVFYAWQAGPLMHERAETIEDYQADTSATSRLEAWSAALHMIANHPVTGVGLASFGPAFPRYSNKKPREAHNTALQITAESGIIAGCMYVLIVCSSVIALWKNARRLRSTKVTTGPAAFLYQINEATLVSLCGLVVCSMFASLQLYEIFYFLFVITNAVLFASNVQLKPYAQASTALRAICAPQTSLYRA